MPPKHQVSKRHQNQIIRNLLLVKFGFFVIWWRNLTFPSMLNYQSFEFDISNLFDLCFLLFRLIVDKGRLFRVSIFYCLNPFFYSVKRLFFSNDLNNSKKVRTHGCPHNQ
jgi:hypothetical protein